MPHASRPGDVLADRYRLVDLLTESGDGRFWRAHDRILERQVALHVIRADDPRAPGLMSAARRSATVHDPHLLRVLDADLTDGVCYVVNEWGTGASLDIVVAGSGPLGPRRAAWLVSEVASAIATAHAAGVSHGRLVPENVLIDRGGGVRIIGLSVDAALHGLPPDRKGVDVADLAGLLYCALTTTWAGPSHSSVAPAPLEHGQVLRPRRVRAGVPRALDQLCDDVLHPRAGIRSRDTVDLHSAWAIAEYLAEFVGDPTGMPEALVACTPDVLPEEELVVLPQVPEMTVKEAARLDADAEADLPPEPEPPSEPQTPNPPADSPTEAGLPIFGDGEDDVSWLQKSTEPAPPPPPFEEPPERPLFAPTPPDGAPVRQVRARATDGDERGADGYWPWESDGETPDGGSTRTRAPARTARRRMSASSTTLPVVDDEVPGRSFLRLAAGLTVVLLVLVAVIVAVNLGRGKTALGGDPSPSSPNHSHSPAAPTTAAAAVLTGTHATFIDPLGDNLENGSQAKLAVDGDAKTFWPTQTYAQQFGPQGLKTGVGLVVDLGARHTLSSVDLTLVGSPTTVALYVTDDRPTAVADLQPAAGGTAKGTDLPLSLDATGRYVVVWLTSLPRIAAGQYRGEVAEVVVRGS